MYVPDPELIETDLESELILLDPRTQEIFSLNATARVIWRALPAAGVEPIVARVVAHFEVAPAEAETDVRGLLEELVGAGLVREDAGD